MSTSSSVLDQQDFIQGYMRCMIWSETDESDESGGVPIDCNYSTDDFPEADVKEITKDCQRFIKENAALLEEAMGRPGYDSGRAGHDFWLTRQGHGAGYWDRDELKEENLGGRLTAACEAFGPHHEGLWVDEGRVHYGSARPTAPAKPARGSRPH